MFERICVLPKRTHARYVQFNKHMYLREKTAQTFLPTSGIRQARPLGYFTLILAHRKGPFIPFADKLKSRTPM